MLLNASVEKLKHYSKNDFKGCQFEACLILEAVLVLALPFELPGSHSWAAVQNTLECSRSTISKAVKQVRQKTQRFCLTCQRYNVSLSFCGL